MQGYRNTEKTHNVYCWTFEADEDDGEFYIPSLAYDKGLSQRIFSCDDSGFNFPEGLWEGREKDVLYFHATGEAIVEGHNAIQYETYDCLTDALGDMDAKTWGDYANGHVVMAIPIFNNDDKMVAITLSIFW